MTRWRDGSQALNSHYFLSLKFDVSGAIHHRFINCFWQHRGHKYLLEIRSSDGKTKLCKEKDAVSIQQLKEQAIQVK
jgi:hypothetical protein